MTVLLRCAPLSLTLTLLACQPAAVLNSLIPSTSFTVATDIAYGEHPRQRMDIYRPLQGERDALLVFVYGGAWDRGSKDDFKFVGEAFTSLGFTTVIVDYRLFPEVIFPDFITDVAQAIARLDVLESARRPLILSGHSAGAHTAALLSAEPFYLESHGVDASRVRALLVMSGPYDLPLDHERVADKFPGVSDTEANPVALATAAHPPTLLLHGLADTIAESRHSRRYAETLEALDVNLELHLYPRRRHVDMLASLARPLRFLSTARADIEAFLNTVVVDGP